MEFGKSKLAMIMKDHDELEAGMVRKISSFRKYNKEFFQISYLNRFTRKHENKILENLQTVYGKLEGEMNITINTEESIEVKYF
jgi:hypothetical protein